MQQIPDKDIFNRKFDPGWRSPARKIFYGVKKEETVPSISRALKRFIAHHPEIKRQFGEIVQILCTMPITINVISIYQNLAQ